MRAANAWLIASALVAAPAAAAESRPPPDLVVAGAGIAGLSAGLEAARAGARVTIVDVWSVFGGHAVMSHGGVCIVGTPVQQALGIADSPELAHKDFVEWGEDPNPDWLRYYVHNSRREIYDWVAELGVVFEDVEPIPGNSVPRFHNTRGRGLGLVSPIYRACVSHPKVSFRWNLEVTDLVHENGRVAGLRGRDLRTGVREEIRARAVVLATGGFQSNLEMVRTHWPAAVPFPPRLLAGSGVNSQGSGHAIASGVGAVLGNMDHQWNYATGLPDPRDPDGKRGLNAAAAAAIWVNRGGRRFVDESLSDKQRLPALLAQEGATYWAIFDQAAKRAFTVYGSDWGDFATVERLIFSDASLVRSAPTPEALAERIGLPGGTLAATVARYNAFVDAGQDDDFGRIGPGKPPTPRIESPPFYAVQFFPLARKSMGGVRIDTAARVVDASGRAIPGLYAAGELTGLAGINGKAGLEGTFLGPSIVTGRVAGRTVVADLREIGWSPSPSPEAAAEAPRAAASTPRSTSAECQSCHDLEAAIRPPRRGYAHFEKAHRVVLDRRFQCRTCHAEMGAYDPKRHRIDRLAQIHSCRHCHVAVERPR